MSDIINKQSNKIKQKVEIMPVYRGWAGVSNYRGKRYKGK